MTFVVLNAPDIEVKKYLEKLWSSDSVEHDNIYEINESNVPELIELDDKKIFRDLIKGKLSKLREIGLIVYNNIKIEEEVNLKPNEVTSDDIDKVFVFNNKNTDTLTINKLMKFISRCVIFTKYKKGDTSDPNNFRYLINHHNTIKILDRLWCIDLIKKIKNNIPDQLIYKASLINQFNDTIYKTAVQNTENIKSIVLLDIKRAFDSLEWDILEELLLSNLTRKTNDPEIAKELVDKYMIILKNREFYYKNHRIVISKGISTGLPSSNLVFTLAIEEIIYRWFNETKYENYKEFIINIFVDDIYIKMLELDKTEYIITSLIKFLKKYKLYVNTDKSKASQNLQINISNKLKPIDFYLGIPFTRNIQLYGDLILYEFKTKKLKWSWKQIYNELCKDNSDKNVLENQQIIVGFMSYKLRPFIENPTKEKIKNFIFINWVKNTQNIIILTLTITILLSIIIQFI